jgi:hypothetical protein
MRQGREGSGRLAIPSASATSLGLVRKEPSNGERDRLRTLTESALHNPVDDPVLSVDFLFCAHDVLTSELGW